MSVMRNASEKAAHERAMYPGPEPRVPVNKLQRHNWRDLERLENEIVARKMRMGIPPAAREISYKGFKALHKHLFEDVYTWAGQERTYTTGRNEEISFATPENITMWMEAQFKKLAASGNLKGSTAPEFAAKATDFINEANAAHSFIEGNGRTQRVFLQILAHQAGHRVSFEGHDKDEWNEASRIGFLSGSPRRLEGLIAKALQLGESEIAQERQAAPMGGSQATHHEAERDLKKALLPYGYRAGSILDDVTKAIRTGAGEAKSLFDRAPFAEDGDLANAARRYATSIEAMRREALAIRDGISPRSGGKAASRSNEAIRTRASKDGIER